MLQPVSSEALSAETHVWCRVLETDMSSVQKDEEDEDDDLLLRIDTNAPFYSIFSCFCICLFASSFIIHPIPSVVR